MRRTRSYFSFYPTGALLQFLFTFSDIFSVPLPSHTNTCLHNYIHTSLNLKIVPYTDLWNFVSRFLNFWQFECNYGKCVYLMEIINQKSKLPFKMRAGFPAHHGHILCISFCNFLFVQQCRPYSISGLIYRSYLTLFMVV